MTLEPPLFVPITVTAKNEEQFIQPCLESLLAAMAYAELRLKVRFELWVVLDDCTDSTQQRVEALNQRVVQSSGGKVEAQRRGLRAARFNLFCDADVLLEKEVLFELCSTMLRDEAVQVAYPRKAPLPPKRKTPLAGALHVYNRRRGFSSTQHWFSGKLFAIRAWDIPRAEQLTPLRSELLPHRFFQLHQGIRADDIYLSRVTVGRHGPSSLQETQGRVWFRAPETFEGMYRYYRRLRIELARTDALCPETRQAHRTFGERRADLLASASAWEKAAYGVFQAALTLCRIRYRLERWYFAHSEAKVVQAWAPVEETKCP